MSCTPRVLALLLLASCKGASSTPPPSDAAGMGDASGGPREVSIYDVQTPDANGQYRFDGIAVTLKSQLVTAAGRR